MQKSQQLSGNNCSQEGSKEKGMKVQQEHGKKAYKKT